MLYTLTHIMPNGIEGEPIAHITESYTDLHHGKYDSQMAHFVSLNLEHGVLTADEEASLPDVGEWAGRFGRRVLFNDSQGFVYLDTYGNAQEAEEAFHRMTVDWDEDDEDDSDDTPVNPYAGPRGLLDEIKQAERILGSE